MGDNARGIVLVSSVPEAAEVLQRLFLQGFTDIVTRRPGTEMVVKIVIEVPQTSNLPHM